jgi:hypothetical protein
MVSKDSLKLRQQTSGQLSLRQAFEDGIEVSQRAVNAMGNFNIQRFRQTAVLCLLDSNLPMELLSPPSFREMINLANLEAEAALWLSPRSVATYVMRLFRHIQPQVVQTLSEAGGKIHISFDGWTIKGGNREFFGIVASVADAFGGTRDLPIDLPQLARAHTGEAISSTIIKTLEVYGVTRDKLVTSYSIMLLIATV